MEARQAKPEYTKIVAAIPHSVSEAHYWQWQNEPSVKDAYNRWTDWFTDELFESEMDGVAVVKAKVSRFECDVARLEGLGQGAHRQGDGQGARRTLDRHLRRN